MPIAPYYPALIILGGAIAVAFGGFLAAYRQVDFDARLNEKNDEIIALQAQQIKAITGGDSYPYIVPILSKDKLMMQLRTEGKYTIYDFQATILDRDLLTTLLAQSKYKNREIAEIFNKSQIVMPLGNLGPNQGKDITTYTLDPNIGHRSFLITLLARNGQLSEYLQLHWVKNWWEVAYKVFNEKGVLKENIGKNFPKDQLWK